MHIHTCAHTHTLTCSYVITVVGLRRVTDERQEGLKDLIFIVSFCTFELLSKEHLLHVQEIIQFNETFFNPCFKYTYSIIQKFLF